MKRILYLLALFLILTTTMNSQIIRNYGFKFGYVSASQDFTWQPIDGIKVRKGGYSASAFIELFDFYGFSIAPEIKYIQKGVGLELVHTGEKSPEPIGKYTSYYHHNYLSIPVSLTYKFELAIGTSFIKIAPCYDILLKSYDDFDSSGSTYKDFKNVFGGTVSFGFIPKLDIGVKPFLEFSYDADFTKTYSGTNNQIKNNAFEICVGLLML